MALLIASGGMGALGAVLKGLLDNWRASVKSKAEAHNLEAQTDIQLDAARMASINGLMEQLIYTQTLLKETRVECDLLREQNNMLRQILADHNIPVPIEDRRHKKPPSGKGKGGGANGQAGDG